MTLRLFAAIALPDEIAALLTPLQRGVAGASWRPRENFHITLRFFGELEHAAARDLDEELAQISEPPFELALKGAGSFGGRAPHAIWVGVEASAALTRLAQSCARAARRLSLKSEPHPFRPHVTMAYCRGTTDAEAAEFARKLATFETPPFWVEAFTLMSSRRAKRPNHYVEEAIYPLG